MVGDETMRIPSGTLTTMLNKRPAAASSSVTPLLSMIGVQVLTITATMALGDGTR